MGEGCSVWFNVVVRGDVHSIRIGNKVNIQDGAVVHCNVSESGNSDWKQLQSDTMPLCMDVL